MSTLRLRIEGKGEPLSFDSFLDSLNYARYVLNDVDHRVTERKTAVLKWTLADLQMNSPSPVAVLESHLVARRVDDDRWPDLITGGFVGALATAEQGEVLPAGLSYVGLENLRRLGAKLGRNGAARFEATYVERETKAAVTPVAGENVKRLMVPATKAIGSIIGKLETVSVHGRHRYSVWDAVSRREVRCEFAEAELASVTGVLGRRVMVSGIVERNTKGEPLKVAQPRLMVMPATMDLPTTDQLIGVAPDFTGDLTTDEYLRYMRDG